MNINIKNDLWHYLAESTRPIVMYGMGNGADKIIAVCEKYGIELVSALAFNSADRVKMVAKDAKELIYILSSSEEEMNAKANGMLVKYGAMADEIFNTVKAGFGQ